MFLVKDTSIFVEKEQMINSNQKLDHLFLETTFKNKTLSSVTQAGFVNNLNDGMIWGLLPILLLSASFSLEKIGVVTAVYPLVWGFGQLFTGKMSDHYAKKEMLFWGMFLQGLAIFAFPYSSSFWIIIFLSVILGFGTALVYPTFLNTIASCSAPNQRAEIIGIFRLWRDFGYAFGALLSGIIADSFGVDIAVYLIAILTLISAMIIRIRMPK
jgi:MFS family permease